MQGRTCTIDNIHSSAAIFAQIYGAFFAKSTVAANQDLGGFLLFLAMATALVSLIGTVLLHRTLQIDPEDEDEERILFITKRETKKPIDIHGLKLIKSVDFWILFSIFSIAIGVGLLMMNNIAYMLISLNQAASTTAITTIIPVSSCLSRLLGGILSDVFISKISRSAWILLAVIFITLSQVIPIFYMSSSLIPISIMVGSSFGTLCSVTVCYLLHFDSHLAHIDE